MSSTATHVDAQLLDFAYGELEPSQRREVEAHLTSCPQCRAALEDIQGVRKVMAALPAAPAPEAGLASLMAYAAQAARRAQAGPPPRPAWWRKWMLPLVGVAAAGTFFTVAKQAYEDRPLDAEVQAATAQKAVAELAPSARAEQPDVMQVSAPGAPADDGDAESPFERLPTAAAKRKVAKGSMAPAGAVGTGAGAATEEDRVAVVREAQDEAVADREAAGRAFAERQAVDSRAPAKKAGSKKVDEGLAGAGFGAAAARPVVSAPPAAPPPPARPRDEEARRAKAAAPPAPGVDAVAVETTTAGEAEPSTFGFSEEAVASAPAAPSPDDRARALLDEARAYRQAGRMAEATAAARQALALSVRDERLRQEALSLLCDVAPDPVEANSSCMALVREFPGSGAAKLAQRRLADRARANAASPPDGAPAAKPASRAAESVRDAD